MRKLIINGLFSSIRKLESYSMLNVSPEVIYDAANTTDATENIWIWTYWIDKAVGEIFTKQEHNSLI